MIDWHCHILPAIDDGSRDLDESLELVGMQRSQGVDSIVATPHFYANDETVDDFLDRRCKSYESLLSALSDRTIDLRLGAEVRYYPGISRMSGLSRLRIDGSGILLVEMPMSTWGRSAIDELSELSRQGDLMLAHVDRYFKLVPMSTWQELHNVGILMQLNADAFTSFSSFSSRHKAISFLKNGLAQVVGSDCHNLTTRPPKIDVAYSIIKKKFGDEFVIQMNEFGKSLLDRSRL